jgi:4-amino-4-deoxy-L-arabinose transferase-like glycosyltransferase
MTLWLGHVLANYLWLKSDARPPFWDTAGHAIAALRIASLPLTTDFPVVLKDLLFANMGGYPPLVYHVSVPLAILFWPTVDALLGINAVFLGVLLLSTYGIGSAFGGQETGLLAAFVVSMYPILYGLARHYLLDFPLVAMVTLSIWLLIRAERFENRGASIAYGLSLGLGLLTKWTFAVFIVGPFLMAIVRALSGRSRRRLTNIALALAVGAAVAAPWYLWNLSSLLEVLDMQSVWGSSEGDPVAGSVESWVYYLQAFVNDQVLLPFAAFLVLGFAASMARGKRQYGPVLLVCWIVLPYLVLSNLVNKDPRFTMPYLPAMAVVTALGLVQVRPRVLRMGLIAFLVLFAAFQFAGLSYGLSRWLPAGLLPAQFLVPVGSTRLRVYAEEVHIASPPRSEEWPAQVMLHEMTDSAERTGIPEPLKLTVVPNVPCLEPNVFAYYALVENLSVHVLGVTGVIPIDDARHRISSSDFVVAKTGEQGPAWTVQDAKLLTSGLSNRSGELGCQFDLINEYPLPDGSIGLLYQHAP